MPDRPFRADRNLRLLTAFILVGQFQPHLAIWVVYLTDARGLTLAQVGVMEAFFWGVKLLAELPTGAFADRFGRRRTFIVGTLIEAVGIITFALAGGFALLLISYVAWSLGFAFRSGNDSAYVYDALAAEGRGAEFGTVFGRVSAAGMITFAGGGILGALLAARTSLATATLAGAIPALLGVVIITAAQEPPRSGISHVSYRQTLAGAWRVLRDAPAVRYAILFEVMLGLAGPVGFLLFQPYLRQHEVPLGWFGMLTAPALFASALGALLGTTLVRRFGRGSTLVACLGGALASLAVITAFDSIRTLPAFWSLQLALGAVMPIIGAYVNDRLDSSVRATVLSVSPLGLSLVLALAGPLAGILGTEGLQLAFGTFLALTAICGGGTLLLWWRADARDPHAA